MNSHKVKTRMPFQSDQSTKIYFTNHNQLPSPPPRPQRVAFPKDVDFRVMLTFLEFYETFLKFTMFKLYNLKGMQYPPAVDKTLLDVGCNLLSVRSTDVDGDGRNAKLPMIEIKEQEAASSSEASNKESTTSRNKAKNSRSLAKIASLEDKFDSILEKVKEELDDEGDGDDEDEQVGQLSAPLNNAFSDLHGDDYYEDTEEENKTFSSAGGDRGGGEKNIAKLFMNLKFFVNREVPLQWLQLCCVSFGGQIGWSGVGSPFDENDSGITHQIIDRPMQGECVN